MKNNVKILLVLVGMLCFFVPGVYAQGSLNPTPEPPKCGMFNGPTAASQQCCTADVKSLYEQQHSSASSAVPSSLTVFFDGVLNLALPLISDNPFMGIISQPCHFGVPDGEGANCKCIAPDINAPPVTETEGLTSLCESNINAANAKHSDAEKKQLEVDRNACLKCAVNEGGFYSDLGCIPGNLSDFISNFVLRIGIGIAGFISLMCIIYSSFLLQVSRGNPEMITKAREQVTSCIIGLIMIIFSVFILRLIGVDILRIPGFS